MAIKRVVKKKRPARMLGIIILLICTVGISSFFYYKKRELQDEYDSLEAEKKRVEMLIQEEQKRSEEIEEYKAYVQTKSYIEEVARDVLGLVYKNEVVFKPKNP